MNSEARRKRFITFNPETGIIVYNFISDKSFSPFLSVVESDDEVFS